MQELHCGEVEEKLRRRDEELARGPAVNRLKSAWIRARKARAKEEAKSLRERPRPLCFFVGPLQIRPNSQARSLRSSGMPQTSDQSRCLWRKRRGRRLGVVQALEECDSGCAWHGGTAARLGTAPLQKQLCQEAAELRALMRAKAGCKSAGVPLVPRDLLHGSGVRRDRHRSFPLCE